MDAEAILRDFTHAEDLPRTALKAVSARRDELLPRFLAEIEDFIRATPEEQLAPSPIIEDSQ